VTFRQSGITLFGTISNGILGFLFYSLMARFLGPSDFGLLTVTITTLTLLGDILDLGTNAGLVRFVSLHLSSDRTKAYQFLNASLTVKLMTWAVVLIVGFALAPFAATIIFQKPELEIPLRLSLIGVGGALLFSFTTASLQAFQKFSIWSGVNIISNALRLLLIIGLFSMHSLNLYSGLVIYTGMMFFGFVVGLLTLPTRQFLQTKYNSEILMQMFRFNGVIAVFALIAAFSSRLDTFLGARILTTQELGLYGAATQLSSVVPQLVTALGVVVAPKFAQFTSYGEMVTYFKKVQLLVTSLSLIGLLGIPLAPIVLPLLFGETYAGAAAPFIILLLGMLVFLMSVPLHQAIFYYFAKPKLFIYLGLINLLVIAILGNYFIHTYRTNGAAMLVLLNNTINFLIPLLWFLGHHRKTK
jgi:O-antigen/teichoic acid export membrane protein